MNKAESNTEPQLVLFPGLDGTGELFKPFIQEFQDPSRVTVIQYPMDRHIPFQQLGDYIVPLLPKGRPLVILGESYSGPVVLSLAARTDINVQKVILVATFAKYPGSLLKSLSKWLPLSLLFRLHIPTFIIRRFCFGSADSKNLRSLLRDAVRQNHPYILARRAREGANVDVTEILTKIKMPCIYIAASHDSLVPAEAIDYLKKHLPGLHVITLPGSHFILQTQPKACFEAVSRFLKEQTAA
jgi:pimeloyl-ACP methyl ester carboxylesterase